MKRVLILSAAVLFCGVPLRAQVTKQVEVTKTYVPEVSKAVKLPIVPDMTDTVRLRPEIDYIPSRRRRWRPTSRPSRSVRLR